MEINLSEFEEIDERLFFILHAENNFVFCGTVVFLDDFNVAGVNVGVLKDGTKLKSTIYKSVRAERFRRASAVCLN